MADRYEGGCLCGAVRYLAEGAPVNERICHCRLCQKAIGAAFNARLMFSQENVSVTGPVELVHSSAALRRGFCPKCGTTLFSYRKSVGLYGITAGSLDDPSVFRPDMHIFTESMQPWIRLDDGLPQYPEWPPA